MASLSFHLHNYKTDGVLKLTPQSVYLVVTLNRSNRKRIKTPLKIDPKHWDFSKQCAGRYYYDVVNFNSALNSIQLRSQSVLTKMIEDNKAAPELFKAIKQTVSGNIMLSEFFDAWQIYINSLDGLRSVRTVQKIESTLKLIQTFDPSTTFDSINMDYFDRLRKYMLTVSHYKGIGYRNDSAAKHIATLKRFLSWAKQRDLHANLIYLNSEFTIKRKSVNEIVRLTLDELYLIRDAILPDRLHKIRDLFLFACYTGQRWDDVASFNHKDLSNGVWSFEQKKTKQRVNVPLVGFSSAAIGIIKKWNEWPVVSVQRFNDYLKEVGQLAGVNSVVQIKRYKGVEEIIIEQPKYLFMSSHMGRRTFVSILINNGVPAPVIMKLTGHTSIKTLMKYIDTNNDDIINALSKVQL